MSQLQWEYQQAVEAYNDAMGWTGRTPGNPLSPADQLIGDAARGGATIANQISILAAEYAWLLKSHQSHIR
jgi:hypothetical protein